LARAVGSRPADVARVLLELDAQGLVSAGRSSLARTREHDGARTREHDGARTRAREHARLTLLGLAYAVRQPELALLLGQVRGRVPTSREMNFVAARRHVSLATARPRAASPVARTPEGALRRRTLAG
jgi:hypothetical protein